MVASAAAAAPKLEVSQPSWDFGTLWHGESAAIKLKLKNAGDADLELQDLMSSCGCTAASKAQPIVKPGETAEIDINFNSAGKFGKVATTITIVSSDPVNPRYVFNVTGEVKKCVTIDPLGGLVYRGVKLMTGKTATAKLQNRMDTPMKPKIESVSPPEIAAELKEIEAGQRYEVVGTIKQDLSKNTRGQIVVSTGHEREPTITVPIVATMVPRVDVQPPAIFVSKNLAKESRRRVQVYSFVDKAVAVTKVECPGGKVTAAEITNPGPPTGGMAKIEAAPKSEVTVLLALPAGPDIPAEGITVLLHTDDPETPVLEVYVTSDNDLYRQRMQMAGRKG